MSWTPCNRRSLENFAIWFLRWYDVRHLSEKGAPSFFPLFFFPVGVCLIFALSRLTGTVRRHSAMLFMHVSRLFAQIIYHSYPNTRSTEHKLPYAFAFILFWMKWDVEIWIMEARYISSNRLANWIFFFWLVFLQISVQHLWTLHGFRYNICMSPMFQINACQKKKKRNEMKREASESGV